MKKAAAEKAEEFQYSLRSSFFYRRRNQFKSWLRDVKRLSETDHDWSDLEKLGISETAWRRVRGTRTPPAAVFCHPGIIASRPHLVGYYRCVAALPQKGTQRLAFGTGALEEGTIKSLSPRRALVLARLFNSYITAIVESEPAFSLNDAQLVAMMNFGAQINGKWRNRIGVEGGVRVKKLLLAYMESNGLLSALTSKEGRRLGSPPAESQLEVVHKAMLINGYQLVFGSEPDVSILDEKGKLQAAMEVKAGLDPAGALERYGAAKKSFDRALSLNKSAETVYLASCITPGVRNAMKTDRLVRRHFDLSRIFLSRKERDRFLTHVKWLLRL